MPRKHNALANKAFKKKLEQMHGGATFCWGCGKPFVDGIEPEWHHMVPVSRGGGDLPTNIHPVCHSCHMKIHGMQAKWDRNKECKGGRKKDTPNGYETIFDNYLHCRISTKEAAEQLKKSTRFKEIKVFKEYLKDHRIESYRNNIDIRLAKYGYLQRDTPIGYIKYLDGAKEEFYWCNWSGYKRIIFPKQMDLKEKGITQIIASMPIEKVEKDAEFKPDPPPEGLSIDKAWWFVYKQQLSFEAGIILRDVTEETNAQNNH